MIIKNGKLILQIQKQVTEVVNDINVTVQRNFGTVYKGSQLVWRTVYNAIKSCFGSGTWLDEKPWIDSDSWKD